jgi:nucleotidyltransferase/DNA polymerase involved in DNA repair
MQDMYYAAVEILDNPELKDKPVAVGSMSMIATANYVARKCFKPFILCFPYYDIFPLL